LRQGPRTHSLIFRRFPFIAHLACQEKVQSCTDHCDGAQFPNLSHEGAIAVERMSAPS